jgi:hypothetical protein
MYFNGKDDGLSIEEYIQNYKSTWKERWKFCVQCGFKNNACIRWQSFDYCELMTLCDEALEKIILEK